MHHGIEIVIWRNTVVILLSSHDIAVAQMILLRCKRHWREVAPVVVSEILIIWGIRPTRALGINSHALSSLRLILSISVNLLRQHRVVNWALIAAISAIEIDTATTQTTLGLKATTLRVHNGRIASCHLLVGKLRWLLLGLLSSWASYLVTCIFLFKLRAQGVMLRILY